jgi:hypothetical protein
MKIVGCDLHARQQTIAMVDTETGEFVERTLSHEGNALREFYAALEGPVVVGIEATGSAGADVGEIGFRNSERQRQKDAISEPSWIG